MDCLLYARHCNLHVLLHLILTITLQNRYHFYLYFLSEKTNEAQRSSVNLSRSHN